VTLDADYRRSLNDLTDEELRERRFEAYDLHTIKDAGSQAFAQDLLTAVEAIEKRRAFHRDLALACMYASPGADGEAFADALFAMTQAQRELDSDTDVVETFAAAFDIARARGKAQGGEDGE